MRTLVFSDVHGNLPALEILLKKEKADLYISLGDVVDYGPWSNECVDLLESFQCVKLMGNHEREFMFGKPDFGGIACKFHNFCVKDFRRQNIIMRYLTSCVVDRFNFNHTINDWIIYPDSEIGFDDNHIIGHSHHQSSHYCRSYELHAIGSVGQNRAFINQIDYAVIEDAVDLKSIVYDENLIINEMKARHYPHELIDYYNNKERCTTL